MPSTSIELPLLHDAITALLRRMASGLLAVVVVGCGSGGGDAPVASAPPTAGATRAVPQTDLEIAQLLYSDSQRTPAGFYSEPAVDGLGAVATMHLKNTDVATGATAQYELCTDDWNEALAWSEINAGNAAPYANLMATDANERFFEFGRLRPTQPSLYVRARVYKCAYLDRSNVNLQLAASTANAGSIRVQPLTATALRTFSEYLWQFTLYNNTGNAVLASSGASGAQVLTHTLYIATLIRATTPSACDRVNVIAWTHSADATGQVQLSATPDFGFDVRRNSGVIELCATT